MSSFIHIVKATFNQRELGQDFNNYPNGLRAALRQAPKVILVGEMRDRATVEIALMAAETGHLVLSTLHTVDAGQSINRILGMFTLGEEQQLRIRLADILRYVVSQRLAPKAGGGRQLLMEIMGNNLRTKEAVALGEDRASQFLRNHRSQFTIRLDDFRSMHSECLRKRFDQRRNRASLCLAQRYRCPRDRSHSKNARREQRTRFRSAHGRPNQRFHLAMEKDDLALFDAGENTALVCVDHQQYQKMVVPQLIDLNYKVHVGLHEEDVLLKLRTYSYDVIVVYENFKGSTLATNPILQKLVCESAAQRREQFVVLLSHLFPTNDSMAAFVHSVDRIVNIADLPNFKPVLRRGMTEHREMYHFFQSTLKTVQTM